VPTRPLVPADDAGKVIGARGLSAAKTERTIVGGNNFRATGSACTNGNVIILWRK
jgi:hypothetical protein